MAMTIVEAAPGITGGVDTHLDKHVAAALDPLGRLVGTESFDADAGGYKALDSRPMPSIPGLLPPTRLQLHPRHRTSSADTEVRISLNGPLCPIVRHRCNSPSLPSRRLVLRQHNSRPDIIYIVGV
jgi:hypothetical protein